MGQHIFIVADDNSIARDAMVGDLTPDFHYLAARNGEEALRLWGGFAVAGGLVSDTLPCEGGVEKFVMDLASRGERVVVLCELPDAGRVALWKERGARECLAHPTRRVARTGTVLRALGVMAAEHEEQCKRRGEA